MYTCNYCEFVGLSGCIFICFDLWYITVVLPWYLLLLFCPKLCLLKYECVWLFLTLTSFLWLLVTLTFILSLFHRFIWVFLNLRMVIFYFLKWITAIAFTKKNRYIDVTYRPSNVIRKFYAIEKQQLWAKHRSKYYSSNSHFPNETDTYLMRQQDR